MTYSRFLLLFPLLLVLFGCTPAIEYPPIDVATAKSIKSGTPLSEIKALLGEPHPPSGAQAKALDGTISKMPEKIKANAQSDESLAWGNDQKFLAVKVNSDGVCWVLSWKSN